MSSLMREMGAKALKLGIPLGVQLDLTYRCNERCVHCYLDHDDHGEMTTAEIKDLLDQLADAGVFFLILSGGEIFLRKDLFEIVEYARKLLFSVKLKTNAVMIRKAKAERIAALGVESVQISVYSHRPRCTTRSPSCPARSGARSRAPGCCKASGVKVSFANVLMKHNADDYPEVQALAERIGVALQRRRHDHADDGRRPLDSRPQHRRRDAGARSSTTRRWSAMPRSSARRRRGRSTEADALDTLPCSAGHTACYVSPYGDVYPCVQFPLPSGNVRQTKFIDIWQDSPQLKEVRSITMHDLQGCSTCAHGSSCYALPGARLHGRQHARPVDPGLREILRAHRRAVEESAGEEGCRRRAGARFPLPPGHLGRRPTSRSSGWLESSSAGRSRRADSNTRAHPRATRTAHRPSPHSRVDRATGHRGEPVPQRAAARPPPARVSRRPEPVAERSRAASST